MIEQDTIKLLRECDAGIKMGVSSIDEVLDLSLIHILRAFLDGSGVLFVRLFQHGLHLILSAGHGGHLLDNAFMVGYFSIRSLIRFPLHRILGVLHIPFGAVGRGNRAVIPGWFHICLLYTSRCV